MKNYQIYLHRSVLLLGVLFLLNGCQNNKNLAPDFSVKETVTEDGHIIKREGKGNNGFVRSYKDGKKDGLTRLYQHGKLAGEISFKNGVRDGVTHCYGIHPCSLSDTAYKDGKKHGVEKLYYEKGVPKAVTTYKNGKKHGVEKKWYEISYKISSTKFYVDGKADGIGKEYYVNGKLERETPYKNGKREGVQKWFGRDGKIINITPYHNDKKSGLVKKYKEGKLTQTIHYKENKKHGLMQTYTKKGEVERSVEYKNDKQIGAIDRVDFSDHSWVNAVKSYGTLTPVQEKTHSSDWLQVSVHSGYFVAVKKDGTLWGFGKLPTQFLPTLACGNDAYLLKKLKEKRVPQVLPKQIGSDKDWLSVTAGIGYVLARKKDGTLWGWGRELIDIKGKKIATGKPVRVRNKIAKPDFYKTKVEVKPNGTLWMWSDKGQRIDGKRVVIPVQEQSKSKTWIKASVYDYYGVAMKRDGTLWWWGRF